MSLGHEFIGKKARPSRDSLLQFWSFLASCSERDSIFLHLCLQEGCFDKLLVILKQKKGGYLYGGGKFQEGVVAIRIAINTKCTGVARSDCSEIRKSL